MEFLGFSDDGSHAAMLEHWINDGSGCPAARVTVMSVDDEVPVLMTSLIWPEFRMHEYEAGGGSIQRGWNPARDSLMEMSRPLLDSLGIGEGSFTRCLHHPLTDLGAEDDVAEFALWAMSPTYFGRTMTLRLEEELWEPEQRPEWFDMVSPPVTLGFTLTGSEGEVLARHADGPAEVRFTQDRFVSDYRIMDVFCWGGNGPLAVVLNTEEPGFEGPDGMFRLLMVDLGE